MKEKDAASAYARAIKRLARRDQSQQQLREALLRESFPEEVVRGTLERLVQERYLDDRGYAARFARTGMRHLGLGRHRIDQGLRLRGVTGEAAAGGLAEALKEVSEGETLEALARRYWRLRSREEPERRLRKLWMFLVRRGFPAGLVAERLRALWPRWEDALDGLDPIEVETDRDPSDD